MDPQYERSCQRHGCSAWVRAHAVQRIGHLIASNARRRRAERRSVDQEQRLAAAAVIQRQAEEVASTRVQYGELPASDPRRELVVRELIELAASDTVTEEKLSGNQGDRIANQILVLHNVIISRASVIRLKAGHTKQIEERAGELQRGVELDSSEALSVGQDLSPTYRVYFAARMIGVVKSSPSRTSVEQADDLSHCHSNLKKTSHLAGPRPDCGRWT
jgi:hypothetical protein